MRNQNQGEPVKEEKFGSTQFDLGKTATGSSPVSRRVVLLDEGVIVNSPRLYVHSKTTDGAGLAVFYLTDDALDTGEDRMNGYSQVSARVNSATGVYAVGWVRVGHTVTVTVNEVTIVAGALNFAAAPGVAVQIMVAGSA